MRVWHYVSVGDSQSYMKPQAGMMWGNSKWQGFYDECTSAEKKDSDDQTVFKGKYCWAANQVRVMNVLKITLYLLIL